MEKATRKYKKPLPSEAMSDDLDKPFWDAAARHEFALHRCQACKTYYWPASNCLEHGPDAMAWVKASGKGTLHTYTIIHRPFNPAFKDDIPYNVAVVETAEGPLVFSNIVGCPNEDIRVGMKLEVIFDDVETGVTIPRFRPA